MSACSSPHSQRQPVCTGNFTHTAHSAGWQTKRRACLQLVGLAPWKGMGLCMFWLKHLLECSDAGSSVACSIQRAHMDVQLQQC